MTTGQIVAIVVLVVLVLAAVVALAVLRRRSTAQGEVDPARYRGGAARRAARGERRGL